MEKPQSALSSKTELAIFIQESIKGFVRDSLENRHPVIDQTPIFDEPLVAFANGDDPLFMEYKRIIGDFHLTPREVVGLASSPAGVADAVSVISWVLPIARKARLSNRKRELTPSLHWAHTRWYGEKFNDLLREHVVSLLSGLGYLAVAPASTPTFKWVKHEGDIASIWSERHAAYVAGLGTFSLSDGFITPVGVAMRCGSVVANLFLPASERKYTNHRSNCLYYRDGSCGVCIDRCPAGAITARGHDKKKCMRYQFRDLEALKQRYEVEIPGCGLCQTGVPCESRIPAAATISEQVLSAMPLLDNEPQQE